MQPLQPQVGPVRTTAVATLSAVVALMPAFFVGATGVFLRDDLAFDEAGLGFAIAVFFATSALACVPGGRLVERIGAGRALVVVGVGSASVMLGIATVAAGLGHLVLLLALAGVWNGIVQPAISLALARGVVRRPAFMFGLMQSAIPLTTLLGGASVPLVSSTVGWRWTFVGGAVVAVLLAVFVPRQLAPAKARTGVKRTREGDASLTPLVARAAATGIGTAASTALGSFIVEAGVAYGLAPGTSGWLLVGGSVAGIGSRVLVGWAADRPNAKALRTVSVMLALGAIGFGLLAQGGPGLLLAGTLLAYAFGWGWTGLLVFATVRFNPHAPAAASGIVGAGAGSGSAIGPLVFGLVVTAGSFELAWSLAALAALVSSVLMLVVRGWLVRDRARRTAA